MTATLDTDISVVDEMEFSIDLPCEENGHHEGALGCKPEQLASYYAMHLHGNDPATHCTQSVVVAVCEGRAGFYETNRNARADCKTCKMRGRLRDLIIVVGKIPQKPTQ